MIFIYLLGLKSHIYKYANLQAKIPVQSHSNSHPFSSLELQWDKTINENDQENEKTIRSACDISNYTKKQTQLSYLRQPVISYLLDQLAVHLISQRLLEDQKGNYLITQK